MKSILILLLLAMPLAASAQWTPPDVNDRRATSKVYSDVLSDTAAERYEDALIKCVWYIDNVEPMRGKSILKPWYDLSTKYPPALKKLQEVSDDSKHRLLKGEGKQLDELFLKYTAIQKLISPQTFDSDTVVAFAALDKLSARAAMRVFPTAMPALTRAKEASLSRRYLEPQEQYGRLVRYRRNREPSSATYAERYFKTSTLELIAALVLCKMIEDAGEVAAAAKKEVDDKPFHAEIDKALAGEMVNTAEPSGH